MKGETESETATATEAVAETTESAHAKIEIEDETTEIGTAAMSETGTTAAKTTEIIGETTFVIERETGKEIETTIAANPSLNLNHRPTVVEDLHSPRTGMDLTDHREEAADTASADLVQEEATASQEAEEGTGWAAEDIGGMADRIVIISPTTNTIETQARDIGKNMPMPKQQKNHPYPQATGPTQDTDTRTAPRKTHP